VAPLLRKCGPPYSAPRSAPPAPFLRRGRPPQRPAASSGANSKRSSRRRRGTKTWTPNRGWTPSRWQPSCLPRRAPPRPDRTRQPSAHCRRPSSALPETSPHPYSCPRKGRPRPSLPWPHRALESGLQSNAFPKPSRGNRRRKSPPPGCRLSCRRAPSRRTRRRKSHRSPHRSRQRPCGRQFSHGFRAKPNRRNHRRSPWLRGLSPRSRGNSRLRSCPAVCLRQPQPLRPSSPSPRPLPSPQSRLRKGRPPGAGRKRSRPQSPRHPRCRCTTRPRMSRRRRPQRGGRPSRSSSHRASRLLRRPYSGPRRQSRWPRKRRQRFRRRICRCPPRPHALFENRPRSKRPGNQQRPSSIPLSLLRLRQPSSAAPRRLRRSRPPQRLSANLFFHRRHRPNCHPR